MSSFDHGKDEAIKWIKRNIQQNSTCLDVGACDGKWSDLLHDHLTMDAVEIYKPYINLYHLKDKYRTVVCSDIADYQYDWYDLIIFGDVIEHMTVEQAQKVLNYASTRCKCMIVAVPFQFKQDAMRGNEHEKHIQDDLTPELFDERYPGFRMIYNAFGKYAYYVKAQEEIPMDEIINKINAVINTLDGGLTGVPMTYNNMSKLVGCMQVLTEVVKNLEEISMKGNTEVKDGDTDSE